MGEFSRTGMCMARRNLHSTLWLRAAAINFALVLAGCCVWADAYCDPTAELDDLAARLQYAFHTADERRLKEVLELLRKLDIPDALTGLKEYYSAYGEWKLLELYVEESAGARTQTAIRTAAYKAAQSCVRHSENASKAAPGLAEVNAIQAVCAAFFPGHRPGDPLVFRSCERSKVLQAAHLLDPANPRVMLMEALCLRGNGAAAAGAQFDKLRDAIAAFELAPPALGARPDWGQAEALVLLGQCYLERGDTLAARDAIERALVLAPDYRKAQELLQAAATRPR